MKSEVGERWSILHDAGEVDGITVVVARDSGRPGSIIVAMMETAGGLHEVQRTDAADKGAIARSISLSDAIFDALEIARITWSGDAVA